ncbi:MAG: O-antigen ligase family protein [Brevundimonas sp.]|uniref:O-antigen ligase family protein n=1 Tax=Brevundimonas sp. TaxID=1871086 RepID=UPI002489F50F|nr:O-antigen ligase family protein [Brevundimonas sp.]MDI1325526.1 O-antigen ligase family protein [Brevundimonas sp.]
MKVRELAKKESKGSWDPVVIAALALLGISILFGGASRDHALRLAFVELAALPLLVLSAERLIRTSLWRNHRFALGLLAAFFAIPLIQLIPLPPAIWGALPGRDQMLLALQLAGLEPGWGPLSLSPAITWSSVLALLPPAAVFLATLSLTQRQLERLVHLGIAAAIGGVLLGAAQLASGGERLYPWATTDAGSVTGFFANRNHLASYLLITAPFAITLGAATLRRRRRENTPLWLGALFIGLVVVGLAAIRSRAGITLFAPVMGASLLAAWIAAGRGSPRLGLLALAGATGAALTVVAILALPPILARFDTQKGSEVRFERWPLVAETAQTYLPLGSGIGSFDTVYRSVEPLQELDSTFFNQAHNDYLETWLEAGWLGGGLILAFLIWYSRRCWSAWRALPSRERDLQRAASIGIGALLLHSVADYPLRTVTLAVLFALICGLLELARRSDQSPDGHAR